MIKRKYLLPLNGALVLALALSLSGCGDKNVDVTETSAAVEETENPNYVPYVQSTVPYIEDLDKLDPKPYFESYALLQDMLEENAKAESAGAAGEIVIDDTEETSEAIETEAVAETGEYSNYNTEDDSIEKALDGGSDITIEQVESFQYINVTGEMMEGDILHFDNKDYVEVDPRIKAKGYKYTTSGNKLIISMNDGRKVEMVCVGNGFVDSEAFTTKMMKQLINDNCKFNTDGAVVKVGDYMNNAGAQDLIKIISSDQHDMATVFRSLNATYVMFYDGNMPYSYVELEQLIRPLKLN